MDLLRSTSGSRHNIQKSIVPLFAALVVFLFALGTEAQTGGTGYAGYLYPSYAQTCVQWAGSLCTSASATWIVPAITQAFSDETEITGQWIGITGSHSTDTQNCPGVFCLGQLGTQAAVNSAGTPSYRAWWELYCANGTASTQVPCNTIQYLDTYFPKLTAGDVIKASMMCTSNCTEDNTSQTWSISLHDVTQNEMWDGNGNTINGLGMLYVYFVEEPLSATRLGLHAPILFSDLKVNGATPVFGNFATSALYVNVGSSSTALTAYSSPPLNGGSAFYICLMAGTSSRNNVGSCSDLLRVGAVFSSGQPGSLSFLRFYNSGTTAGTASVTLSDYTSGQQIARWTSPSIAPGAAPQFSIVAPEGASGIKPQFYSVTMQSSFPGTFQHVLWHPSDGTLTNLSTCDAGVTSISTRLVNIHSSLVGNQGYPSSVVVYNTGTAAEAVTLAIADAGSGIQQGTYTTAPIPPNGQIIVAVADIETAARIVPMGNMYHYVISVRGPFTGYLQHLINNQKAGVVSDMTTVCALGSTP
jgi:hypothetical protein